jgi:hypothetical protein
MQLPWIACPDISPKSTGWRMGRGEEAYTLFYRAFSDLSAAEREEFAANNPEPEGWEGTYAKIAAHPWPND